jgi:hypothetical protein
MKVQVLLPGPLRDMIGVKGEVAVEVERPVTARTVIDALEARWPALGGTIRDHVTGERRAFLRFFACQEDLSLEGMDAELPAAVAEGRETFLIVAAIAGGSAA